MNPVCQCGHSKGDHESKWCLAKDCQCEKFVDREKLLPCPFCGRDDFESWDGLVHHPSCGCMLGGSCIATLDREREVKQWNTRAPDPRVERLIRAAHYFAEAHDNRHARELEEAIAAFDGMFEEEK